MNTSNLTIVFCFGTSLAKNENKQCNQKKKKNKMKHIIRLRIKAQIAMAFATILLLLTATAPASVHTIANLLKLHKISSFRKISLKGNIEVVLVQSSTTGVSYADDNEGNAEVTKEGEILHITGNSKEPCKLVVYVNDLFRIVAEENTVVRTRGMLSTKFLQIVLKGNANADIRTKTQSLYTAIYDTSALHLRGYTDVHFLFMEKKPTLTTGDFIALRTQEALENYTLPASSGKDRPETNLVSRLSLVL